MGTICFSVAENLRCAGLTRQESLFLLIPALIEGVVGLPLLYIKWGRGWMYWLFALEGITYAILATVDYFAHTRASSLPDANVFKGIDIFVGASSSIPLLCYICFLYFFSRATLFPLLSSRYETIVSRTLLALVPIILAFNEISAFLGIHYTTVVLPTGGSTLGIGFYKDGAYRPWNVIANATLALITTYQVVHFIFAFLHFFQKAYRGDRIFSSGSERDMRLYSLKGTGWLAAGLKFGAVETVIGFAGFGFAPTILRRVLRVLGRGFVLVGVCISPDAPNEEGFNMLGNPRTMTQRPTRNLRALIANPQTDTFRRLSASATAFYGLPRAAGSGPDLERDPATSGAGVGTRRFSDRVTVRLDASRAPVLEMRFSDLDIHSFRSQGSSRSTSDPSAATATTGTPPRRRIVSAASDSLEAVQALDAQFPMLPPRAGTRALQQRMRASTLPNMPEADEGGFAGIGALEALQRKLSRRKPAPAPSPTTLSYPPAARSQPHLPRLLAPSTPERARTESFVLVSPYIDDDTIDYEPPTPRSGRSSAEFVFSQPTATTRRTFDTRDTTPVHSPHRADSWGSRKLGRIAMRAAQDNDVRTVSYAGSQQRSTMSSSVYAAYSGQARAPFPGEAPIREHERTMSGDTVNAGGRRRRVPEVPRSARFDSTEVLGIPWLAHAADEHEHDRDPAADNLGRVKSVGAVAVHTTPTPRRGAFRISAIAVRSPFGDESVYDDHDGASGRRGSSVDSGVLSPDDRAMLRASLVRARGASPLFSEPESMSS